MIHAHSYYDEPQICLMVGYSTRFLYSVYHPQEKKALVLPEFIMDLPIDNQGSLVNEALPEEHLFLVSTDDP